MKKDLFEPELSRHLAPVKAPEQLWDRVQRGQLSARKSRAGAVTWQWAAAAAATAAVVLGITFWLNRSVTTEELAVQALSRTADQVEFRSDDLVELRTWVKAGTGLELPFPGRTAPAVRLIGASLTRSGTPAAEIAYKVGDMEARLVVAKAPPDGDGRHTFKKSGSYHGANFQSWTMRGQMYTIAAADARVGCLLCHSAGAPPRTTVN